MEMCQGRVVDLQRENDKLIKNIHVIYEDMELLKRDNEELHCEITEKNTELD